MNRWVMAVGENPLRVLRVAQVVQPVEVALITTQETHYLVEEIEAAAASGNIDMVVREVRGDAYRSDVNLAALKDVVGEDAALWHWLIAGGTKPMTAAQAALAGQAPLGQTWALDDGAGRLNSWQGESLDLTPPRWNIGLRELIRLHAGLEFELDPRYPVPDTPGQVSDDRIRERRDRWVRGEVWSEDVPPVMRNRVAESDFMALVRAVLPTDFVVYPGTKVFLRDSSDPSRPAANPYEDAKELLRVWLIPLLRDVVLLRGCRYAEEVP